MVLLAIQWNTLKQFCYQELPQYTSLYTCTALMFLFSVALLQTSLAFKQVLICRIRSVSVPKPRYFGWIQRFSKPLAKKECRINAHMLELYRQAVYQITFAWMHRNWFSSRMCFPCLMLNHWPETKSFRWKMFHISTIVVKCLVFIRSKSLFNIYLLVGIFFTFE